MGSAPGKFSKEDAIHGLKVFCYAFVSSLLAAVPALLDSVKFEGAYALVWVLLTAGINSGIVSLQRWVEDRRNKFDITQPNPYEEEGRQEEGRQGLLTNLNDRL